MKYILATAFMKALHDGEQAKALGDTHAAYRFEMVAKAIYDAYPAAAQLAVDMKPIPINDQHNLKTVVKLPIMQAQAQVTSKPRLSLVQ